jgi:rhodanese-related sulfurtransferase
MKFNLFIPLFLLGIIMAAASGCKDQSSAVNAANYSNAFQVDVRTPEEFAAGSATGAVNIPVDEVASRIEEFRGKEAVVVFCRSGNRSAQALEILNSNGITNVTNGGTWQQVQAVVESHSSDASH